MPIGVFESEAAIDFLCATAARKGDKDREEAATLAEQLGRLPLALAHAASKCRGARRISFADYGRRLEEFWREHPNKRAAHGGYGSSVYATFSIALEDILTGDPNEGRPACPEAEEVAGRTGASCAGGNAAIYAYATLFGPACADERGRF